MDINDLENNLYSNTRILVSLRGGGPPEFDIEVYSM